MKGRKHTPEQVIAAFKDVIAAQQDQDRLRNEAEAYAKGRPVTVATCMEIGKLAVKATKARTSWRASKDYREHLVEVLTERAVLESAKRAGGSHA